MGLSIALLHFPMVNKLGASVTTSVTNFDIHDIARAARTYALDRYFIVTPVAAQRDFTRRVMRYWVEEAGAQYNPTRGDALALVEVAPDLAAVGRSIRRDFGSDPLWVATSARASGPAVTTAELRRRLLSEDLNVCLLFGTGHGLHPDLLAVVDSILEPIDGLGDYNHLSVRSAVSIYLDRLLGPGRAEAAPPP